HEIDPRCGGWTFDRGTSLKFFRAAIGQQYARLWQSGLRQAFDDTLKISGVLVRQHALTLRQREAWIHLEKPRPCRARVVRAPEMAVAGGEHHAARIGGGGARDALEELLRGGLLFAPAGMGLGPGGQDDGRLGGIEAACEPGTTRA